MTYRIKNLYRGQLFNFWSSSSSSSAFLKISLLEMLIAYGNDHLKNWNYFGKVLKCRTPSGRAFLTLYNPSHKIKRCQGTYCVHFSLFYTNVQFCTLFVNFWSCTLMYLGFHQEKKYKGYSFKMLLLCAFNELLWSIFGYFLPKKALFLGLFLTKKINGMGGTPP